ncbi:MAG: hypothetical protein LH610_01585 [Sphingomonas bacterium]|nr:hypothetical protein [Sphingomonas bacterium]
MFRLVILCTIATTALGCEPAGDKDLKAQSCEQKIIEATGNRPVAALLTYYPGVSLRASIAGCPKSDLSVRFEERDERLRFFRLHRGRKDLPIVSAVRFRIVGLDNRDGTIAIDHVEVLDRS